ncbi:MAG: aminomethyl-transferring glycine dehydrogenase subunit GcvPB [Thermoplasmata archaeon]
MRNFHEARWEEPVIFKLSRSGERGILVPGVEREIELEVGDVTSSLPDFMIRKNLPALPEISQMRVLKHYLRLSQENLGADLNVDIGQGTCTMKYSPKVNETFVSNPRAADIHPHQDVSTIQGTLEIIYRLDLLLRELSGMDKFSFQPGSGSQAIFAMASIIRAYFRRRGEEEKRDEIITTIFSHPSDAAAPAVKGFKIITIYPDENGIPDIEALKATVSDRTAGLIIANPEDTGIFNPRVKEFTQIVHEAGGLCAYDQANANGLLGIARAKESGFDMCFFNLHKTFSTPHGSGGPACGALGVSGELTQFLPVPIVEKAGSEYFLNYNIPHSIGKVREFHGVFPAVLRAYAWIMSLGAEGLKEVSQVAVLNNNYVMNRVLKIRGAGISFPSTKERVEQVRYSWNRLTEETGVTSEDIIRRMADFGFHLWTSHHPFIIPQPFTIEPTESYSRDEMDEYLDTLEHIAEEAYTNPDLVKNAPYNSVVHKIDRTEYFDDPKKWAITWRAYIKKHVNEDSELK